MPDCCGSVDECVETIEAGRLMFNAIMDGLCNAGTPADDGRGAERIDAALAAWVKADPKMGKQYK